MTYHRNVIVLKSKESWFEDYRNSLLSTLVYLEYKSFINKPRKPINIHRDKTLILLQKKVEVNSSKPYHQLLILFHDFFTIFNVSLQSHDMNHLQPLTSWTTSLLFSRSTFLTPLVSRDVSLPLLFCLTSTRRHLGFLS